MGQLIEVQAVRLGDVLILDTDRSLTGQDGESYSSLESAESAATLSAQLAARLFEDQELAHVYVFSNAISVQRRSPWTDQAVDAAAETVRTFFVFYGEEDEPPEEGP